jgi:hypothetical protein
MLFPKDLRLLLAAGAYLWRSRFAGQISSEPSHPTRSASLSCLSCLFRKTTRSPGGAWAPCDTFRATMRLSIRLGGAEINMKDFNRSLKKTLAIGALTALGALAAVIALSQSGAATAAQTGSAHRVAAHAVATAMSVPVKTYGVKTAPITMEAFTDYQCPACRALFENALKPMINDYVASGKVYLIHHDFPLASHQYSGQAARWANAAASVGEFGPVETALFDNQPRWEADGNISKWVSGAMSPADFERVQNIMKSCTTPAPQASTPDADPLAKSGRGCPVDQYIAPDIKAGFSVPVNYTPTYIIYYQGRKLATSSDVVSWPILKQLFDSLLRQ